MNESLESSKQSVAKEINLLSELGYEHSMKLDKSRFTENLIRLNSLRFRKWIFEPGMLFSSEEKWWGDKGRRVRRHNGLDMRLYETDEGKHKAIGRGTIIPIIYTGRVTGIIRDVIGFTLFAAHGIYDGDFQLYTIYGHVIQTADVSIGAFVREGAGIATPAGASKRQAPCHLHISVTLVPKAIPPEDLTWQALDKNPDVRFLDPIEII